MKYRWKLKLTHIRKRLALTMTSLVGSGAMLGLFGASAAMALTGRGCLSLPFHGSSVVFPRSASTVGVRFQGEANDQAVSVTVNGGKISPNPTPGEAGLLVPNLRTLFVQQLPFGKSFDFT